jgi:monoamine oxidase
MEQYDVLVIGAGAAGLLAALELALAGRKVCIIEAKEKSGGRIQTTYNKNNYPIESGAEFVHGDLPLTLQIFKKASIETYKVKGSIWQKKDNRLQEQEDFIEDFSDLEKKFKELKEDIPVASFIKEHLKGNKYEQLRFTLKNYVEGYYAADINKASTYALCEELTKGDDVNYRIEGGYQQLVSYLEQQCIERGVEFFFSQPVLQLHWKKDEVEAVTTKSSFKATKALITVSIGVLQNEGITLVPSLPQKIKAAKQLGFGHVLKITLEFENAFWKNKELTNGENLDDMNFLFFEEEIPTWWTQYPKKENIITGWMGGPASAAWQTLDEETLIRKGLQSLSKIFNTDVLHLGKELLQAKMCSWSADPHFNGSYSYAIINGGEYMKRILEPVEQTIYFAGEGLHDSIDIGTVEAALVSGREVAHNMIAGF